MARPATARVAATSARASAGRDDEEDVVVAHHARQPAGRHRRSLVWGEAMIRTVRTASRRERKKAMRSRAFLNDVDVSSDCFYADDRRGVVHLFLRDDNGRLWRDGKTGRVAWAERRGRVRIERRP